MRSVRACHGWEKKLHTSGHSITGKVHCVHVISIENSIRGTCVPHFEKQHIAPLHTMAGRFQHASHHTLAGRLKTTDECTICFVITYSQHSSSQASFSLNNHSMIRPSPFAKRRRGCMCQRAVIPQRLKRSESKQKKCSTATYRLFRNSCCFRQLPIPVVQKVHTMSIY